jgi:sensor histidine kinase YesM
MLGKLAAFFRMTLAIDPTADVRLVEELALQKTYLEIEQLRYPDLRVDIDVPATLNSAIVPTLILQPIVENAVKYGVAGSNPPAWISIRASSSDGRLTIQVTDSGRPARQPTAVIGGGIGLSNVRERLSHRFGEDYQLGAGYVSGAGYCVTITIPLETSVD